MAKGRKMGDHDARRVEIAEAACRVFLRLGLARTSLADIAREIGNTTGVLRHYFADKDEMLLYAKNLIFDRSYERASSAAARCHGLDTLRAMAGGLLPANPESVDGYRLLAMFNGSAIGDSRLMKLQDKRNATHSLQLAELISRLQKEGILLKDLNPRLEAAGVLALVDGLAEQVIMRGNSWSREQLISILNRHIDNLCPPKR
jgi:AcrR family transcriptional regulator